MSVYLPAPANSRPVTAAFIGIAAIIAVFSILPLLRIVIVSAQSSAREITSPPTVAPKVVFAEKVKPPIEEKKLKKIVMEKVLPPVDFQLLERALQGTGDGTGDSMIVTGINDFIEVEIATFLIGELDRAPKALVAVSPNYPYAQKGIEATVVVEFIIDAEGRVKRPRIHSSTSRDFDSAAIESVTRSKWRPGEKDGKAVATLVRLPINFMP